MFNRAGYEIFQNPKREQLFPGKLFQIVHDKTAAEFISEPKQKLRNGFLIFCFVRLSR